MRKLVGGLAAVLALTLLAAPAGAQYSDSYTFLKAVKDRDGNKVTDLLATPGTTVINAKDPSSGDGALHTVIRRRDLTWLSFLLGKGAQPNLQNDSGQTPLALAAQLGWFEGAQLLLNNGAKVDLGNERGETPLIIAVHQRDPVMVRLLLSKGADPNKTDNVVGYSALDYAKQDPRAAAILKLLQEPRKPAKEVAGPVL